ncbi:hypothetical protein AQUCO_01300579v1 [Aquilegia coerulea]|uniref:Pentacotripeptide-repeat region of PRORP domain-containing protein n=1 Tax=Aquilegia coerulea TaxID=218851 RepID=A0A2G5E2E8_AQUCA|nr:hypothetical protein AQUCO_01300579v1 [Aquilegia coerulea]PIA49940.1 hypothetical protein AQUCO_01300579v1 [Aquilegia coerulea]
MVTLNPAMLYCSHPITSFNTPITKSPCFSQFPKTPFLQTPRRHLFTSVKFSLVEETIEDDEKIEERNQKYRWIEIGPNITESQKEAISKLPPKMTKRNKAFMKQIICFDSEKTGFTLFSMLRAWVKIMKPKRADWLLVLKEMAKLEHPLIFEVTEFALLEDSFEANIRDYTKLIDGYAKQKRLQDAEDTFQAMKSKGLTCDQITFTVLIQMYSKAGNLNQAEETFEELKLLGLPVDKRAYGAMIMAYVRAGMPQDGENLLREMEAQEIYAGKEVYKALLRAYSNLGDTLGAQRVFDLIQLARISPDVKLCALLINAHRVAGQSDGARSVFDNLRRAGLEPSDKCVALMLGAYEKENKLNVALDLLMDLEKDNIMVGKEASEVLVGWFRRLGVVDEMALVLSEYASKEAKCMTPVV